MMETKHGIALDVDGVLAGFQNAIVRRAQEMGLDFYDHYSEWNHWMVHDEYRDSWEEIAPTIDESREFWFEEVEPLPEAHVPYEVEAYVSARRGVPDGLTEEWLEANGFPSAPVHITDDGHDKVEVLREETNANVFVDDKVSTVETLQDHWEPENGVPYPVLFNQPHNSLFGRTDTSEIWTRAYYLPEVPDIVNLRLRPYQSS